MSNIEGLTYRAIIPVKTLSEAKSRLAPHLTQRQRETLVLDMLRHVVQTLCASQEFEVVTVVSPDIRVLEKARIWGARASLEERHGHNPALQMAALRDMAEGATALLTISADLPLLTAGDINVMVERSTRFDVVLAPSMDGTGTNAMLVRPPLVVPYLFGVNSLQRHQRAARQRGLSSNLYSSRGLSLDIDTIEDVQELTWAGIRGEGGASAPTTLPPTFPSLSRPYLRTTGKAS
jgi:2-phospho-L-lactate/phosphoenolpyruvate guanylyltransferase